MKKWLVTRYRFDSEDCFCAFPLLIMVGPGDKDVYEALLHRTTTDWDEDIEYTEEDYKDTKLYALERLTNGDHTIIIESDEKPALDKVRELYFNK